MSFQVGEDAGQLEDTLLHDNKFLSFKGLHIYFVKVDSSLLLVLQNVLHKKLSFQRLFLPLG